MLKRLKNETIWVAFKTRKTVKGLEKRPFRANDLRAHASSTDKTTWSTFDDAMKLRYKKSTDFSSGLLYLGFAVVDPFVVIDLDHCIVDGELNDEARAIVDSLNSYTEISPSKTGLHIIVELNDWKPLRGKKDSRRGIEVYFQKRLMTYTGDVFENRNTLRKISLNELERCLNMSFENDDTVDLGGVDEIITFVERSFPTRKRDIDVDEIVREMKRLNLWDVSDYTARYGNDVSTVEYHFIENLGRLGVFHPQTIETVYKSSPIYEYRKNSAKPDKWDERRGSSTYGDLTVKRALLNSLKTSALFIPSRVIRFGRTDENASKDVRYLVETFELSDDVKRTLDSFDDYLQKQGKDVALPYVNRLALAAYLTNTAAMRFGRTFEYIWVDKDGFVRRIPHGMLSEHFVHAIDVDARRFWQLERRERVLNAANIEYEQNDDDTVAYRLTKVERAFVDNGMESELKKLRATELKMEKAFWDSVASFLYVERIGTRVVSVTDYSRPNGLMYRNDTITLYNDRVVELPRDVHDALRITVPSYDEYAGVNDTTYITKRNLSDVVSALPLDVFETTAVRLYREHWDNRLDELLDFIAASYLATDTKQSFLFISASSDFGKSYLFERLLRNISYKMSLVHTEKLAKLETVGVDVTRFEKSLLLYFEEVRSINPAILDMGKRMNVSAKFSNPIEIETGAKIFLSADNPITDSIDAQYANRFSVWEFSRSFRADTLPKYKLLTGKTQFDFERETEMYVWVRLLHAFHKFFVTDNYKRATMYFLEKFHERYRFELPLLEDKFENDLLDVLQEMYFDLRAVADGAAPASPMPWYYTYVTVSGGKFGGRDSVPRLYYKQKRPFIYELLKHVDVDGKRSELRKHVPFISAGQTRQFRRFIKDFSGDLTLPLMSYLIEIPDEIYEEWDELYRAETAKQRSVAFSNEPKI